MYSYFLLTLFHLTLFFLPYILEVVIFIVWYIVGTIVRNILVSSFVFIQTNFFFNQYINIFEVVFTILCCPCIVYVLFWISTIQRNTLYCSNDSETITQKSVVGGLFFIKLIQYFCCVHHHTKTFTRAIFLTLFHFYLLYKP